MGTASTLKKAEESILRTMGIDATFTTYGGDVSSIKVLPKTDTTETTSQDFRSRDSDERFETLASYIPDDWRDATIAVDGVVYNVLDVSLDAYKVLAEIRVE